MRDRRTDTGRWLKYTTKLERNLDRQSRMSSKEDHPGKSTGFINPMQWKDKWNSIHSVRRKKPYGFFETYVSVRIKISSTYQRLLVPSVAGTFLNELIFRCGTDGGTTERSKRRIPDLVAEDGSVILIVDLRSDIQAEVDHE